MTDFTLLQSAPAEFHATPHAARRDGGSCDSFGRPRPLPFPPARQPIGQAVSQVFGVDVGELDGDTRGRAKVALARQVAMYLAHVTCGLTLTDVGRMFSRDRTTVAHACAVIEDRRDDPTFDRAMELLELVVRAIALPRGDTSCRAC